MLYRISNLRFELLALTLVIWVVVLLSAMEATAVAGTSDEERFATTAREHRADTWKVTAPSRYTSVVANDASNASLSITSPSVREGGAGTVLAIFTVSLSQPIHRKVTFAFQTVDGTATAAAPKPDYLAASGTGSIPAGKDSVEVQVGVLGDKEDEPDETFIVKLTNADVSIDKGQGVCTIEDDDLPDLKEVDPIAAAVGNALNEVCPQDNLDPDLRSTCEAVAELPADQLIDALRAIAAEEAATQGTVSAEAIRIQLRNLGARLADLHASATTVDRGDDRLGFFVNGTLGMGDRPATIQETGFDLETRGIIAGIDYRLSPTTLKGKRIFFLGAALGYYSTHMDLSGNGGSLETRGASLSAYMTYVNDDRAFHLDGIVTYGRGELDFERRINFPGVSPQVARSAPDNEQLAFSIGGGRNWKTGAMTVRGFGRIDHVAAVIDGYTEQGAPGFDLVLEEQKVRSLLASVGMEISYFKRLLRQSFVEPVIRLDVVHEFEDDSRPIEARFVGDPVGTSFIITTDEPDRDYLNLRFGLSAQLRPGRKAYLFYSEDLERRDLSFYSVSLGVRLEF